MIATYHKTVHGVLRTRTISKMNIETYWNKWAHIKTSRPEQHDRRFADNILKCIFFHKNVYLFLNSLIFANGLFNNSIVADERKSCRGKPVLAMSVEADQNVMWYRIYRFW